VGNSTKVAKKASIPIVSATVVQLSTGIDSRNGSRAAAEKIYGIDKDVLDKLGEISGEVGTDITARKAIREHDRPHTPEEVQFMHEVIKAMIRRLAQYAATGTRPSPSLRLADLPTGTGLLS